MPDPQKFFVGIIDFFSILLPGALIAYLAGDGLALLIVGHSIAVQGSQGWAIFIFASYLLGHLAFLVGAGVLDELVYDPLRKCTDYGQIVRLARGKARSANWWRFVARMMFRRNPDAALVQAQRYKAQALQPIGAAQAINAFQWAKAWSSKDHAAGFAAVQRFEADSKFFRSLSVVLIATSVVLSAHHEWTRAMLSIVLLLAALWRYLDQRFKATQQAYWSVIFLESKRVESLKPAAPSVGAPSVAAPSVGAPINAITAGRSSKAAAPTHAGGVVHRDISGTIQFLFVQPSDRSHMWVLPKGHVESGEDLRETAVREVLEETGCWARVEAVVDGDLLLNTHGETQVIRFYQMQFVADESPTRDTEGREHRWLSVADLAVTQSPDEAKNLIDQVHAAMLRTKARS